MEIALTPDMEQIVRQKVESGQFSSPADVVRKSLRLLSAQDTFHALQADVAAGIEQAAQLQLTVFRGE